MPPYRPLRERLFSRLVFDPDTGCLLWTGLRNQRSGYGQIKVGRRNPYVHRVFWEMLNGPVPAGLELDHLCRVRHCANLAHLEPVTRRENLMRGDTIVAANDAKTHCSNNHEYDLLNTYWRKDGGRNCRACDREAHQRRRAARS